MRKDIARANDALTVVNDWQLHLFKNGDAAASIFGAVGLQAISFSSLIHLSNMNLYSNENKHFIKLVRYFTLFLGHCYCGRTMRWINLRVQERRRLLRNSFQNIFQLLIWMDIAGLQCSNGLASHQLFCIYKVTKLFLAVIRLRPFHVLLNCKLTWQ